jgi:hypothetical protein
MTDLTLQAATDAALVTLLLSNGLLVPGEGGAVPPAGVAYSHIGEATLNDLPLSGRYAWVGIDDAVFGEAETASLLLALEPHRYTGPDIRVRLGGAGYQPSGVPFSVTMRQARLALADAGMLPAVEVAINGLPEPDKTKAKITWEYSTEVQRSNGLVPQMAAALGMTDAQIDALFIVARDL